MVSIFLILGDIAKPLEEYMISHTLLVMYQKMEKHARMWKSEFKRLEKLLLD
jgi:hypothetical protein